MQFQSGEMWFLFQCVILECCLEESIWQSSGRNDLWESAQHQGILALEVVADDFADTEEAGASNEGLCEFASG